MRVAGGTGEGMLDLHKEIDERFELLPNPAYANVVGTYKMMLAARKEKS